MKRLIALYDLDGTLLSRATFTPFLIFAARKNSPWRLTLIPVWIGAMIGYKANLWSREALKQFGLRLFLGNVEPHGLSEAGRDFARAVMPQGMGAGAAHALDQDRAGGRLLVLCTAAMEFYAADIAAIAGFDHVIATRHDVHGGACRISGGNCYGTAKVPRVAALLKELGLNRADCDIRFYTDSVSDAPLLDWVDEGVLVNVGGVARAKAMARGWQVADFR